MKLRSFGVVLLLVIMRACSFSRPATAPVDQPGVGTIVAETMQALTPVAPVETTPAPNGIPVKSKNVSFVIPDGLASGATTELIPVADESNSDPWSVAPEHILFTLTGYSKPVGSFDAVIRVYPAQEYATVNSWAEGSLTRLQAILASPAGPLTNDTLPTVPFNGAAAQQYAAQAKLLAFNGGTGVRMLSQYGQFPGPITKENSFYHYEGLTSDGKYLIAILLPVFLPLQATADNPSADGITFPSDIADTAGLTSYYQGITDKLNAASPDSFQPSLALLDALVQSVTVTSQ
jgi:hypothetical protein